MSQPGVLPGADVLDPGVDPVGGVGVGALAAPASGAGGQVRGPQRVALPAGRLEERELGAGVGPLAAGEDPHRLRPGFQLVAVRPFAQQAGQFGHVRFFYPAGPVRAARIRAGLPGAALADLAFPVDGGFRAASGTLPITARSRAPSAQPTE